MDVVIADDDKILLHLVEAALVQRGHVVHAVCDGGAAWAAIERSAPPLVVLDWQMPVIDGLDVCRRLRATPHTAHTFVLMVTGRDRPEDLANALEAGADDYLQKPIAAKELAARCAIAERRIQQDGVRRHAEEVAARAQWLAGIGQTAIALQHEVNNPLSTLMYWADLAARGDTSDAERREAMGPISEECQRIADVVKRLSSLQDPQTVEYVRGIMMLDLGSAPSLAEAPRPKTGTDRGKL
jgi:DNA-binding response OmpR family regulator